MPHHLYLHIPFCHRICPYCSFHKHLPGSTDLAAFGEALLAELDGHLGRLEPALETIYFGGGTPTFLSRAHLDRLFAGMQERLDLSGLREWTVEANPATFDLAKATMLRERGVTRLSLGVQSWIPRELELLGRDHAPGDVEESFATLRKAGFENINVDLMFSLPGQSLDKWRTSLERTLALEPDHVSTYNLTYEEDTEFLERHRRGELDADPERDADQFLLADALLGASGFEHYEISNYARPGFASVHNRGYWSGSDYLGLGPGAVSTIAGVRWKNLPDTGAWITRTLAGEPTVTEREELTERDRTNEAIALQLRTTEGLPRDRVAHISDADLDRLAAVQLLELAGGRIRLTRDARLVADSVAEQLLA